jgi:hypothetical protein
MTTENEALALSELRGNALTRSAGALVDGFAFFVAQVAQAFELSLPFRLLVSHQLGEAGGFYLSKLHKSPDQPVGFDIRRIPKGGAKHKERLI